MSHITLNLLLFFYTAALEALEEGIKTFERLHAALSK